MADFNAKAATPKDTIAADGLIFGAESQDAATPSVYTGQALAEAAVWGRGDRYLAPSGDTTGAADRTAMMAAAASGVRLLLGRGTFYLPGSGVAFTSLTDFTLDMGGATIKPAANASVGLQAFGPTVVRLVSCTRSRVINGVFDGNGKTGNLLGMTGCADCDFSDNELSGGNGNSGQITGGGNTRCRVSNNIVRDGLGESRGIWFGNIEEEEYVTGCAIVGNRVYSVPASGIVYTGSYGVIFGNTVHSCDGAGIVLSGYAGVSTRLTSVMGNTCRDNLFHGIQADVYYEGDPDDLISDCTISGNVCSGHPGAGINMIGSRRCAVVGNTCIDNTTAGIQVDDESFNTTVSGNTCSDTRAGAERTQIDGIRLVNQATNGKGISITGNSCANNARSGIHIENSEKTLSDVTISGNATCDNAVNGIFLAEESAQDFTRITVTGNVSHGNGTVDIRVSAVDVSLSGNRYGTESTAAAKDFASGDTTPYVGGRKHWRAANSSATTITDFEGAENGMELQVFASNSNTTLQHGTLLLAGAVNAVLPANGSITLLRYSGTWLEVSRSF